MEGNSVRHVGLRRNRIDTKYVQEKGYCNILVLLYMLFVNIFIRTRECNRSTKVGVEPIYIFLV